MAINIFRNWYFVNNNIFNDYAFILKKAYFNKIKDFDIHMWRIVFHIQSSRKINIFLFILLLDCISLYYNIIRHIWYFSLLVNITYIPIIIIITSTSNGVSSCFWSCPHTYEQYSVVNSLTPPAISLISICISGQIKFTPLFFCTGFLSIKSSFRFPFVSLKM